MDTHKGGRFWPTLIIAALLLISSPSPAPTSAQTARPGATWGDGSLMHVAITSICHWRLETNDL